MAEVQRFDRLRAQAQRRRWFVGLRVDGRCRTVRAALVGVEGRGLASRVELFAHERLELPREVSARFERLKAHRRASPAETSLLAAQLAESQAALLDELAPRVAPVWERVLAIAVDDPGVWRRWQGLQCRAGLCDAARLAELCGQNVIDAFADRDLAQGGQGRPLEPVPEWILLHDAQHARAVAHLGRMCRMTYLPPSRDATGAVGVRSVRWKPAPTAGPPDVADAIVGQMTSQFPQTPPIKELFLRIRPTDFAPIKTCLGERMPDVHVVDPESSPVPTLALPAASVAVLGQLHVDQVPANSVDVTGARVPRVLGRLTPGLAAPWHRMLRDIAAAGPAVMSLRSAI